MVIIKSSNVPAPVTDPLCVGPSSYIYSFILLLLLNLYRDLVGWEVGVGGWGGWGVTGGGKWSFWGKTKNMGGTSEQHNK